MTDRLSLLRAILANPREDTPRLMLADWLQEHGTTDADKARVEFIRLWYRLTPNMRSTTKALAAWLSDNWLRLMGRVAALAGPESRVRLHGRSVAAQLVWGPGQDERAVLKVYYDRGFAERVQFSHGAGYVRLGAAVAADEPLAVLEPEQYPPTQGTYPDITADVSEREWGPAVFARLTGFDTEPTPGVKQYASGYWGGTGRWVSSYERARAGLADVMTAIAREANGLTGLSCPTGAG